MATKPDVRIRLSAEGVKEVVDALKQVQAQAGKSQAATGNISAGMDKAAASVSALKGSIGALSAAFATIGGLGYLKGLNDHVIAMGRLSQITGMTVEQISNLTNAFKKYGVDEEGALGALGALAEKLYEARTGAGDAAAAFRDLGLELKDNNGKYKDLRTMLGELADAYSKHADGIGKASNALMLMGDDGARLLPVLNQGAAGIARLEAAAAKAGATIDKKATEEAQKFNNSLVELKSNLDDLARTLTGPVVEGLNAFIDRFQKAKDAGKGVVASVRDGLGLVGNRSSILKAEEDVAQLTAQYEEAHAKAAKLTGRWEKMWHSDLIGDEHYYKTKLEQAKANLEALRKLQEDAAQPAAKPNTPQPLPDPSTLGARPNLTLPPPPPLSAPPSLPKDGQLDTRPELPTLGSADLAKQVTKAEQDKIAAEAALRLAQMRAENQKFIDEQTSAYEKATISLKDYYDTREALAIAEAAAEKAAAEAALKAAEATPTPGGTQLEMQAKELAVAQAKANMTLVETNNQAKLEAITRERAATEKDFADQKAEYTRTQLEQSGQLYRAEEMALDKQIDQYGELLKKMGLEEAQIKRLKDEMRDAGLARARFNQFQRDYEDKGREYDGKVSEVDAQVKTGRMWGAEGDAQKLKLDKERLATMKELVEQMDAEAKKTGSREMKLQVDDYRNSIRELELATNEYGQAVGKLQDAIEQSVAGGLDTMVNSIVEGTATAKDAVRAFAFDVINSIRKVVQQLLVQKAIQSFFGAFGGGGTGGLAGLLGGGGYATGGLVKAATGGYIRGPGTTTSDSIPALLSDQEYVLNAEAVKGIGVDTLDLMNKYGSLAPVLTNYAPQGGIPITDGGLADSINQAAGGGTTRLEVAAEPGLFVKQIKSPEGAKALVEVIASKRQSVRKATS